MPLKLVHFMKYKTFFFFINQTFYWYVSKMYLWVLTLATKSEPTLIGQLALSLQMISILDVVSSSIALWGENMNYIFEQIRIATALCLKLKDVIDIQTNVYLISVPFTFVKLFFLQRTFYNKFLCRSVLPKFHFSCLYLIMEV